MYERSFGKLLYSNDDDETGATASSTTSAGSVTAPLKGRSHGSKNGGISSEEGETGDEIKDMTGNDQSNEGSNAGSDVEDSEIDDKKSLARTSAREARSRRRQAKIDDDIIPGLNDVLFATGNTNSLPSALQNNKRQRLDGGEVVKVNLLTGTLYLYRGKQRRAEFIRRV